MYCLDENQGMLNLNKKRFTSSSDVKWFCGNAEKLPFKNECFDFVIASHVLEHSTNPTNFLSELQRVAKAGYIEVPDAFMERLTNYTCHRLEISEDDNGLVIKKKKDFIEDKESSQYFFSCRIDKESITEFSSLSISLVLIHFDNSLTSKAN